MLVSKLTDGGEEKREEPLSTRIVQEVARRKGVSTDELESIYNVVEPDALDTLFQPKDDGTVRADGVVKFTYAGYEVTVDSDRTIELLPTEVNEE